MLQTDVLQQTSSNRIGRYVDMLQGMYVTPKVWLLHIAAER